VPYRHILKREKPPHPRNLIGPNIRRLRKAAKPRISQEDLCGRVAKYGVVLTRSQVAKIEAARRPVFDYEALAIARALKLPLPRLFGLNEG
jgi:transcriptional regulator with XRE-family HTH domain